MADDVASSAELFRVSARYRRPPVWGDIHVTLMPEGSGSTCITARAMAFPNLLALVFSPERRILDQFAAMLLTGRHWRTSAGVRGHRRAGPGLPFDRAGGTHR